MNLKESLSKYLEDLSSSSPTPGGGNVSALCGVLSSSLGMMVCSLTIGKKKYLHFEKEAILLKEKLENARHDFLYLAEKDNEAFDKVMDAFKLPKETEEDKEARKEAIERATFDAAIVPADVIKKCREIIPLLGEIAENGNQNSLSDAGVAFSLISTAAQGAFMNVLINCASLSNQVTANEFLVKTEIIYNEIREEAGAAVDKIMKKMRSN